MSGSEYPGNGWRGGWGGARPGERGYKRKKLAAMAGSMYRVGATAVTEIRETYAQQRSRDPFGSGATTIPGSFPDVAISVHGDDQLIVFPSYAMHHVKDDTHNAAPAHPVTGQSGAGQDQDYWRHHGYDWEQRNNNNEDERAIVDVDVRGWVYSPHKGQLTRKNRILLGLARRLSGVPAPRSDGSSSADSSSGVGGGGVSVSGSPPSEFPMSRHEQERIAKQAAEIERRGQQEKRVAGRGDYSEMPKEGDDEYPEGELIYRRPQWHNANAGASASASANASPGSLSPPASPTLTARTTTSTTTATTAAEQLSDAELAVAHATLMARIAPFLTNPFVQLPVSVFFYNETRSGSRTVMTNEAGHFVVRAALDFVPTHVRVLANERLSAIREIAVTPPRGVSVISDIDDTVKRSNISAGTREIFRNTFVRDLADLRIEGVREWYAAMWRLGVAFHYCSNSPWQLFPVLASFFSSAGLPPGSLHLKQYTGMLQGIFEPAAERKRGTLVRLLRDFPQRRFLLVGDSGEADLEVYTELAVQHPGRVLGIFIRDVTTPTQVSPFFSAAYFEGAGSENQPTCTRPETRPAKPPRPAPPSGPAMGTLVDLSDEPEGTKVDFSAADALAQAMAGPWPAFGDDDQKKKPRPPPRPSKPVALRGRPAEGMMPPSGLRSPPQTKESPPEQLQPWKPASPVSDRPGRHPLSQVHSSVEPVMRPNHSLQTRALLRPSKSSTGLGSEQQLPSKAVPPPPPALPPAVRRRPAPNTPSSSEPRLPSQQRLASSPEREFDALPPPPVRSWGPASTANSSRQGSRSTSPAAAPRPSLPRPTTITTGAAGASTAVNKKIELWRQRLVRAQEALDHMEREGRGRVALYTWRTGGDVVEEALGIVRAALDSEGRSR